MNRSLFLVSVALATFSGTIPAQEAPAFNPLFADHMVLQRDQPVRIWGTATGGTALTIALNGSTVRVTAASDGRWRAELPALPTGGPHRITLTDASGIRQTIDDVLMGDLWLCSGQSNMEFQVDRALDSRAEIQNAGDDRIRLLQIDKATALAPLSTLPAKARWQPVNPESIRRFSALCYFTARELRRDMDVPMGLINSSWGGSNITTWMSEAALRSLDDPLRLMDLVALRRTSPDNALRRWESVWQDWWSRSGTPGDMAPWRSDYKPDARWRAVPAFTYWESWGMPELASFNGMVWYRTEVTLTAGQAAKLNAIELGRVDEVDEAWVNGQLVGTGWEAGEVRHYPLPQGLLKAGRNVIAVNALDTYATGGMNGPADRIGLTAAEGPPIMLPLDGWKFAIDPRNGQVAPRAPWNSLAGQGMIFNAMIAPLGDLGLRGVLWYQGESNADTATRYGSQLSAWMTDWRRQFNSPRLPFLIVQLAGYGAASSAPGESDWAVLREQQRLATLKDGNAALVVAIDLGERTDIHPANKQELARRTARAARHLVYGSGSPASGPVPRGVTRAGQDVIIEFSDVLGKLVTYSSVHPIGFELCGKEAGSCRYATATLESTNRIRLQAEGPPAQRVRFCWAQYPICTLFDSERQPAGPFELGVSP